MDDANGPYAPYRAGKILPRHTGLNSVKASSKPLFITSAGPSDILFNKTIGESLFVILLKGVMAI